MLKKIILVFGVVALITYASVPARANDDAAYFLGGVVGGLLLGEVIQNNSPRYYYPPPPPYGYPFYDGPVYGGPIYQEQCYTRWIKRWSESKQIWVRKRRTVCNWVRVE